MTDSKDYEHLNTLCALSDYFPKERDIFSETEVRVLISLPVYHGLDIPYP